MCRYAPLIVHDIATYPVGSAEMSTRIARSVREDTDLVVTGYTEPMARCARDVLSHTMASGRTPIYCVWLRSIAKYRAIWIYSGFTQQMSILIHKSYFTVVLTLIHYISASRLT